MRIQKIDKHELRKLLTTTVMFLRHADEFTRCGYPGPNNWIYYARENIEEIQQILNSKDGRKRFKWFIG
jgi:hypothetical protein